MIVIKQISQYLKTNFFDERFSLEYRTCMIYFCISYIVSILLLLSGVWLAKGAFSILLPAVYLVLCTVILFFPVNLRILISKFYVASTVLFYIPCFFFQTSSLADATLLFAPLGVFIIASIFSGRTRVLLVGASVIIYVGCIAMQYLFPGLIPAADSPALRLVDLSTAMVLAIFGLSYISTYILSAFSRERQRIQTLLDELERSNTQLAKLSQHDALTGIYNRRYLIDFLDRTLESCNRSGRHIYFMMMDVDLFKQINDTYGHGFGDEVLVATAAIIGSALRKSDALVRFGGEEFAAVLYGTNDEKAVEIANRICKSVRSLQFRYDVQVTISVGLVRSLPDEPQSELIERADQQLYRAKHEGRNHVCHKF